MKKDDLLEVIEDLCYQFAYDTVTPDGPALITGGLSALEGAFEALGWTEPHLIPDDKCDEPGCTKRASCGWPDGISYRRTCSDHMLRMIPG